MSAQFDTYYLICIDHGDDINYVLHRTMDLVEARTEVKRFQKANPKHDIYLTMEKVASKKAVAAKNPVECNCGYGVGQCIGFLSCRCEQLASCKRVDQKNPLSQIDMDLEFTYRNPFGQEGMDLEYAYNPEEESDDEAAEEDGTSEEGASAKPQSESEDEEWKQWATDKTDASTKFGHLIEGDETES